MSKEHVKIIQNILKKQGNFDLAIKFENVYYSFVIFEEFNDLEKGILNLYEK